jgi:hypothetical protein
MEVDMTEQYANPGKTGPPNFMAVCDEIRAEWLSRVTSEAELATKLMEKITAARSMYDAMAAYQEWMSARMDRFEEDNRRLWGQTRKAMEATGLVSQPGSWTPGRSTGLSS